MNLGWTPWIPPSLVIIGEVCSWVLKLCGLSVLVRRLVVMRFECTVRRAFPTPGMPSALVALLTRTVFGTLIPGSDRQLFLTSVCVLVDRTRLFLSSGPITVRRPYRRKVLQGRKPGLLQLSLTMKFSVMWLPLRRQRKSLLQAWALSG